jgi:hypothetical protein
MLGHTESFRRNNRNSEYHPNKHEKIVNAFSSLACDSYGAADLEFDAVY